MIGNNAFVGQCSRLYFLPKRRSVESAGCCRCRPTKLVSCREEQGISNDVSFAFQPMKAMIASNSLKFVVMFLLFAK